MRLCREPESQKKKFKITFSLSSTFFPLVLMSASRLRRASIICVCPPWKKNSDSDRIGYNADPDPAYYANADPDPVPDPGFWWPKIGEKNFDEKKSYFVIKIAIYLFLGQCCGSGSGSASTKINADPEPDPQHRKKIKVQCYEIAIKCGICKRKKDSAMQI